MLPVTRPTMVDLDNLIPDFRKIWESKILTNSGPFHDQFEAAIADKLEREHVTLVANATSGLILSLAAMELTGEVITTPFTYAATVNSICWAGMQPVFADIDENTLTLSVASVERNLSSKTGGILPVHLFGRSCDLHGFESLSKQHGLPIIYDAAQAFGLKADGRNVVEWGDSSILSFHATKQFNSIEGGAIVSKDRSMKQKLDAMRNNGISPDGTYRYIGLNAKMSELHAAVGLAQLPGTVHSGAKRQELDLQYRASLASIPGIRCFEYEPGQVPPFSYFPIAVDPDYGKARNSLWEYLQEKGINARQYFSPLISSHPQFRDLPSAQPENLPVATRLADRILCLPMYTDLTLDDVSLVAESIATFRSMRCA